MLRTTIGRLALGGATGALLVLTGCSAAETNGPAGAVQLTPLSDTVVVSQPYCTTEGTTAAPWDGAARATAARATPSADPGCEAYVGIPDPNAPDDVRSYTTSGGHRLLVAVQVADGEPAPQLALRRRPGVAFVQDPAVLAVTQDSEQAPAGRHWVGYRSGEVRFAVGEPDAGDVIDATVAIPRTADRPASAAVETTIAIGAQMTDNGFGAEYDPDRPVDCREDLSDTPGHAADVGSIACPLNDGGDDEYNRGDVSAPQTAVVVPSDAAITTPAGERTVPAGDSTTVPFTVAQSGVVPEPGTIALRASTTIPGGRVSAATGAVPWPAAADATAVPVSVAVPAGTAAGVYDVTLEGSDEGGSRSATARLRVPAAPVAAGPGRPAAPAAPAAPAPPAGAPAAPRKPISTTVKLLRLSLVSRRTRRLHVGRVTCVRERGSGPCVVVSRVTSSGREIGRVTVRVAPKTSAKVTVRLTRSALAKVVRRAARATTTVSAPGSADVVRTTVVRAKALPKRRG